MPDFLQALQNGSHNLWLFIPTAIFLGALHGLEPGHSKTMMAAFIIAIRGTVWQAILLGLSAAISHSLLIWILAAVALHYGSKWDAETVEPYLQLFSAACILALAAWMFFRTRREVQAAEAHKLGQGGHTHGHGTHSHSHGPHDHGHTHDDHDHDHDHGHDHGDGHGHHHHHEHDERVQVPLGHGVTVELSIFEKDCPPVFRIRPAGGQKLEAAQFTIVTVRQESPKQSFSFVAKDGFLESSTAIPEPHEFNATLIFNHDGHNHDAKILFREGQAPRVPGAAAAPEAHRHDHGDEGGHDHGDGHGHHHHHEHDERVLVPLGHGVTVEVSIFEKDCPPVFRVAAVGKLKISPAEITMETTRTTGAKQTFTFVAKEGFLESATAIPEPHEFDAVFTYTHDGHGHPAALKFREGEAPQIAGGEEFEDAHERAHADDIARRFAGRTVTTPQIVLFGITGGLMPCPAAFTVLLVCLQLKRAVLGFTLVAAFSFGLAVTMVATGALAAISVKHAQRRFRGFGEAMRRAPYVSCVLLVLLATYMAWQGWAGLTGHHH